MDSSTAAAMEVIKGRMYDYNNARFLSVDPFIQSPTSTQSMNPYTYIFNNPLSGTDPSGYNAEGLLITSFESNGFTRSEIRGAEDAGVALTVGAVVGAIEIVDQITDVLNPLKGGVKAALKQGFKLAKNKIKNLLKNPKKALSNGNKNKQQSSSKTKSDNNSNIGNQSKINSKGDTQHSKWKDSPTKTKKKSIPNTKTDVSKKTVEKNLEKSGYKKSTSKDRKSNTFNKKGSNKSYSTRNETGKNGKSNPTLDVKKDGKVVEKIRLDQKDLK